MEWEDDGRRVHVCKYAFCVLDTYIRQTDAAWDSSMARCKNDRGREQKRGGRASVTWSILDIKASAATVIAQCTSEK